MDSNWTLFCAHQDKKTMNSPSHTENCIFIKVCRNLFFCNWIFLPFDLISQAQEGSNIRLIQPPTFEFSKKNTTLKENHIFSQWALGLQKKCLATPQTLLKFLGQNLFGDQFWGWSEARKVCPQAIRGNPLSAPFKWPGGTLYWPQIDRGDGSLTTEIFLAGLISIISFFA